MSYLTIAMAIIAGFLMMGAAAALLLSWFPESFGWLKASRRRVVGIDAVFALAGAAGLALLTGRAGVWLMGHFHAQAIYSFSAPEILVSRVPALAAAADALRSGLLNGALFAAVALFAERLPKRWMIAPLALVAAFVWLPLDLRTGGEFLLAFGISAMAAGAVAAFAFSFGRRNYLAWAMVLWCAAMRTPIAELLENSNNTYRMNGWIAAALAAAPVLWAVIPALRAKTSDEIELK
jgi:hypothetical protein